MILRDDEHEAVAAERIGFEPARIDRAGDDAKVGDALGNQSDNLVAQSLFEIDADIRMRGEERRQRLGQKLGQRIGVRQHADLAGKPAAIGAEVLMQAFGLAQDGAGVLQQRAPGRRQRHALPAAGEERHAEHILHIADARRGCGQCKMRALGAVCNAAGFDDMAKQTEIGEVEAHGVNPAFVLYEIKLHIMPIAPAYFNAIVSCSAKQEPSTASGLVRCCIAARARIG